MASQQTQQPPQAQQSGKSRFRPSLKTSLRNPLFLASAVGVGLSALLLPPVFPFFAAVLAGWVAVDRVAPRVGFALGRVIRRGAGQVPKALSWPLRASARGVRAFLGTPARPSRTVSVGSSRSSRTGRGGGGHMDAPVTAVEQRKAKAFDEKHGTVSKDKMVNFLVDRLRGAGLRVNTNWNMAMEELRNSPEWEHFKNKKVIYGFVYKGVIHLNTEKVSLQTPIHEYTHIWAEVLRHRDPEEWAHIVGMMKEEKELWKHVQGAYPHLTTDDEIADEVLATYSGRHGAAKLSEYAKMFGNESGFGVLYEALARFWAGVADFFGFRYETRDEIADRVLYDMLSDRNPLMDVRPEDRLWSDGRPSHQAEGSDGHVLSSVSLPSSGQESQERQSLSSDDHDNNLKDNSIMSENNNDVSNVENIESSYVLVKSLLGRLSGNGVTAVCKVLDEPVGVPGTGKVGGLCVFADRDKSVPLLLVDGADGFRAVRVTDVSPEAFAVVSGWFSSGSLNVAVTDVSDGRRFIDFYQRRFPEMPSYPIDDLQRKTAAAFRINEDGLNPGTFVAVDRLDGSLPSSMEFIMRNGQALAARNTLQERANGDMFIELDDTAHVFAHPSTQFTDKESAKFFAEHTHGQYEDYGSVQAVTFPYSSDRDNREDASLFMNCFENWPGRAVAVVTGRTNFGGLNIGIPYEPLTDAEKLKLRNFFRECETNPLFRDGYYGRGMQAFLKDDFAVRHGFDTPESAREQGISFESVQSLLREVKEARRDAVLDVLTAGRSRDVFFDVVHASKDRVFGFCAAVCDGLGHGVYVTDDEGRVSQVPMEKHHERLLELFLPELRSKYLAEHAGTRSSVGFVDAVSSLMSLAVTPKSRRSGDDALVLDGFFRQVPESCRPGMADLVCKEARNGLAFRPHNERWFDDACRFCRSVAAGEQDSEQRNVTKGIRL